MAENGVNGHRPTSKTIGEWRVGLLNHCNKYLTCESFGAINAEGALMKKKQIWVIEPTGEFVFLRTYLGTYLSTDKYGKVIAIDRDADDFVEEDAKFQIEYAADGNWAFQSKPYGNYFSCSGADVKCFSKKPCEENKWSIQLFIHPQIHLRNKQSGRYAHMRDDLMECTEKVPWGSDALVLLDFEDGKYTLKSFDNRFLNRKGTLEENSTTDCRYTMEIHSGCLAFKDIDGQYLCPVGTGALKSRNKKAGRDELFTIEDSHPQVQIIAHNNKSVSTKQGVDVSANQTEEIGDTEIFQMEYNKDKNTWAFLGKIDKNKAHYWSLQAGTVQATSQETRDESYFGLDWQDDGTVGIKAHDGNYLSNKQTGVLFSNNKTVEDVNKFRIVIVNRNFLVLKSDFGFVGLKSNQYMCNKAKYDILKVEHVGEGAYTIQGSDDGYWNVGDKDIVYPDSTPMKFQFQFLTSSIMAIRAPNGCYLQGEQNGLFKATAKEIGPNSSWEF